ncbi:hypothetical protein BC829DRAFT_50756 [Chytridium lagenaria]|nr:hypothetical protein BC829DRAFT_50756 [Chytridium lagenaria]
MARLSKLPRFFEDKGVLLADSEFGLPKEILDDIYSARNIMRPMDVHDFQPVIQHLKRTISNFGKPAPSSRKGKDEAVIPIDKKRHDAIEHLKASHHPTLFDLYIASTPRTIKYTKNRPKLPHIRPDSWLFEGSEMAQIIAAVETVQNESYSTQNILDGLDSQVDATHHASPEKYLWKCRPDVPQGGESSQERTGWGEAEELHDLRRYIDEILPRPQAIAEDGNSHNVRSIRDIALDWIARDLQLASAVLRSKTTEEEIEQVSATELGHRSMKKLKRRQMPSQSSSVVGSDYGDRSYDSDAESSFMSSYSQAASSIGDDESFDDLESLATSSSWGGDSSIATSEAATDGEYLTEDEMRMSSEDEDDEVMADFDDAASQASQRSFTGMSLPLWVPRMSITHALRPNKPIQLSSRAARLRDRWLNPNAYYRSIKRRATSASGGSQTHTRQSSQNWQDGEEEWDGSVSQIDAAAALKFRTLNEELEREQELSLRVSSGRLSVGASKGSSQRQSLPQDRRISMPARLVGSGTSRRETLVATSQPMETRFRRHRPFRKVHFRHLQVNLLHQRSR